MVHQVIAKESNKLSQFIVGFRVSSRPASLFVIPATPGILPPPAIIPAKDSGQAGVTEKKHKSIRPYSSAFRT